MIKPRESGGSGSIPDGCGGASAAKIEKLAADRKYKMTTPFWAPLKSPLNPGFCPSVGQGIKPIDGTSCEKRVV